MFLYNTDKEKQLFVTLPSKIEYNFEFLNSITELMENVECSNCKEIFFSCNSEHNDFNKMGTAYLYNAIRFFSNKKTVYASRYLMKYFQEQVWHTDGDKFEKVEMRSSRFNSSAFQCYCFKNDKQVNQTVQILVDFIADKNLIFKDVKEFLITTIGEIFSNAFNHSEQKQVFFMYDIEWNQKDIFLVIDITDFGKTIVSNVKKYHKQLYGKVLRSNECIDWAMKSGNTTRKGSGGYGLPTLVDYVKKVEGELLIFSGDSIYTLKKKKENIINAKGNFDGTSVSMKIPLFDTSRAILYDGKSNRIVSIDLDKI